MYHSYSLLQKLKYLFPSCALEQEKFFHWYNIAFNEYYSMILCVCKFKNYILRYYYKRREVHFGALFNFHVVLYTHIEQHNECERSKSREREIFKRTTASKSGKLCLTLQSNLHIRLREEALISVREGRESRINIFHVLTTEERERIFNREREEKRENTLQSTTLTYQL